MCQNGRYIKLVGDPNILSEVPERTGTSTPCEPIACRSCIYRYRTSFRLRSLNNWWTILCMRNNTPLRDELGVRSALRYLYPQLA
jgi:hypothetical protein